jgi:hypothetical protein
VAFGGLTNKTTKFPQGVFHFNGRSWTQVTAAFQGGSALNDRNVWAYTGTTIAHFDGRKWTQENVAGLFPAKTPGEDARRRRPAKTPGEYTSSVGQQVSASNSAANRAVVLQYS